MSFPDLPGDAQPIWLRFKASFQHHRVPQALLLQSSHPVSIELLQQMYTLLLCHGNTPPCGQCQSCLLIAENIHPDLEKISNVDEHPVKIEQIRTVQERLFLPPQLSSRRVIYFEALDRMTVSASQALLKILEEPPKAVYFIALTQTIHSILPTILSRFQRWNLAAPCVVSFNYLDAAHWPTKDTKFKDLLSAWPTLVESLLKLKQGQLSVYCLAESLGKYPFLVLMDVLYCIVAQAIRLRSERVISGQGELKQLIQWSALYSETSLFELMKHLEVMLKQLRTPIPIQPVLNLEYLLTKM
jgi:hypothetical protein